MWMGIAAWSGSQDEFNRLVQAVAAYCTCEPNKPTCPPHAMISSQKTLDDLLYVRTMRTRYQFEEFTHERIGE